MSGDWLERLREALADPKAGLEPYRQHPPVIHLSFSEWKRLRKAGMIDEHGRFVVRREAGGEEGEDA